jgi:hypothetical protein
MAARFWAKVDKTGECWKWVGALHAPHGYGVILRDRRLVLAHRMSWELTYGAIPPGMQVLHKCDNKPCVRPTHLWLGTQQDNVDDMISKGRRVQGAFNPLFGEDVHGSKLTSTSVRVIRRERAQGRTLAELANKFGVSIATISLVARGLHWKHVS